MNETTTEATQTPRKTYQAQEWDSDCECWQDMDHEGAEGHDRHAVEQEAKHIAGKCAYRVRTRVVRS